MRKQNKNAGIIRSILNAGPIPYILPLCIGLLIIITGGFKPGIALAATSSNSSGGELHAFYPSNAVFSEQMKEYIDSLDSISFAWSRVDVKDPASLNTVKGKNGNNSFYYPTDYLLPVEYARNEGKTIQLSIYMEGSDATELLPDADQRTVLINTIVNSLQTDITQGEEIYYDGVVIDFEGLRNTDSNNKTLLYNGQPISTYLVQFLNDLKSQLTAINKTLYVAVNPGVYYDGYAYADILDVADRVIIMAHDYEPTQKLSKTQVLQYSGYDVLEPISSMAPIVSVRQALNEIQSAASDSSELSKVWLQIAFDSAQWRFDVSSAAGWEKLAGTTLSREGRLTPLYQSIKARVDNTDGYGQNITYGYNNELQSPYLQYYNTKDSSFNIILYEDSNSILAKINLAKTYGLGGISLWSLANVPDYDDATGKKYYLNGWTTIVSAMDSYATKPAGSSSYVTFTDKAVEQSVRDKLGKATGKLSVYDLQGIYRLKLSGTVKSLKDLKQLTNLEYLSASQLSLKSITYVGSLTKLRVLYLQRNSITDISALSKLTKLEVLSLNGNQISSISSLASLTKLRELYLRENKIKTITALSKLTKLEILEIGNNSIQKTDSLKKLTKLTQLSLDYNQISDITSLASLTKLQYLNVSNNKLVNIKTLKKLTALETLYLQRNTISDITPLAGLTKLKLLSLNGNKISTVTSLTKLVALEKLYLKDNQIKSVTALKTLVKLKELYLSGNKISDYSPLRKLYPKLTCDFKL